MPKFDFDMLENIVGKGENAGYQHFLLFPTMFFKRILSLGCLNKGFCGKELNTFLFLCGRWVSSIIAFCALIILVFVICVHNL